MNKGSGTPPAVRQEQSGTSKDSSPAEIVESLQELPAEKRGEVIAWILKIQRTRTASSGPLPTPEDFEKYGKTLPGAAERILSMAE